MYIEFGKEIFLFLKRCDDIAKLQHITCKKIINLCKIILSDNDIFNNETEIFEKNINKDKINWLALHGFGSR